MKCLLIFLFFSCGFSELFGLKWEGKRSLSSLVQNGRENGFLCFQFDTGIRNNSPLVWALGIRKRFLDFVSGMEVSSRNSHLMHLLKELFASGLGKPKPSAFSFLSSAISAKSLAFNSLNESMI
ncbi:hypothetical protein C1645_742715 [Glomus cerebriforme]|uniref:Uncharacterized protein n=1 Tax=Glomus cerebriforme TaxID=658196 RepID=A0A397SM75_9GLOM|nr:hypothetical protein C1645_742715 [Glomus cerebriforme]